MIKSFFKVIMCLLKKIQKYNWRLYREFEEFAFKGVNVLSFVITVIADC